MQRVRVNPSAVGGIVKKVAFFDWFSGSGGAAEGAIQAGALVVLAVDCWEDANNVHRDNHPSTTVLNFEIGEDPEYEKRLLEGQFRLWRSRGYHIHLHCSPPCKELSSASTTDAEEGMRLVYHCLWLVDQVKPDSWSMENVVPMRKRLPEHVNSVVLNAADFGVPQTRKRCIAGEGWFAKPTHSKDEFNMLGLPKWLSVLDALPYLEEECLGLVENINPKIRQRTLSEPMRTITSRTYSQSRIVMDSGRSSAKTCGINPKTGEKAGGSGPLFRSISQPAYTVRASYRGTLKLESTGANANRNSDSSLNEPSKTICGGGNQVGPRIFNHQNTKPLKLRSLTLKETAMLQSYPSTYSFEKGRLQKYRWEMIGNSVPPLMMKAIVEGIF